MTYDGNRLRSLGDRLAAHRAEGKRLSAEVRTELPKALRDGLTYVDIGRMLKCTGERVRQIAESIGLKSDRAHDKT